MTTIVDKEYSSKVFRTLLAVPNFSKVAVAEVFCKKGVLAQMTLKCEFWKKKQFIFANMVIESYSRPIKAK